MTPERWKKIEDIFQDALDLSGEARKNFIDEKTLDDGELRAEVEKLVARFEAEEKFLESPVWTDSVILGNTLKSRVASSIEKEIAPDAADKAFAGKTVGVYRLTEQIGKGGMGVVYAAERADGEFSQKVAVKLIKRGMDTDFIVSRFRHERQILANLNHQNIARLFDGGTTDDGSPYFIMEFIEGEPFLKYCEKKNLELGEKLKLFLQVCAPIGYAHKRKIIHRDIKPSNILVTDEGMPKLLDFGIAKILDADSIHESFLPTATAMRLMTPEYASPEQVRGEEITPASDQYSLGVLLYELLTGERPYKFTSRAPHEIARVICEEIPSEPSSGSFGKFATGDFDRQFDEESCKKLDRIVLKTLRKNPSERYASVEAFAEDIERFLRKKDVSAESFEIKAAPNGLTAPNESFLEKTGEIISDTNGNRSGGGGKQSGERNMKTVSPRWKGVKQGIFITVLSVILIPVFLIITVTAVIPPPLTTTLFLLFFFSGIARILYALLLEAGKSEAVSGETPQRTSEAETRLIDSVAPRETITGKQSTAEKTEDSEKSIAVLPFRYLNSVSGENTDGSDFLSVGLADSLITRISNVRQFVVRPTSAILRFNAAETDSLDAGKELNVRFVVEGSIIKTEKRIRVSVQLLDVENRSTIWAERFEEDFTDVLEIEDLISAKVVESLLPKISGEQQKQLGKRGTENAAAHEAYLRGRYHFNSYTDEGFQKAIEFYEKAVALDPNYALAYAAIADYYVWISVYDVNPVSPKAKKSALKAIALDDQLSEAYAALGLAILYSEYDWKKSEENLLRAIELNPNNSVAHLWYSHNLYTRGHFPEGTRHVVRAIDLDPLSYLNHNTYSWSFYFQRRYDEALKLNDELLKNYPQIPHGHFSRGCFLDKLGRTEEAFEAMQKAVELSNESLFILYGLAQTLAAAGKRREVEKLIEKIKKQSHKRYFSNYQTAIVYCYLNDTNAALGHLEKSFENRDSLLVWLGIEPSLDPVRGDARYQKLLEKINFPLAAKSEYVPQNLKTEKPKNAVRSKVSRIPKPLKYVSLAVIAVALTYFIYNIATHLTFTKSDSSISFTTSNLSPNDRWKNNFTSMMSARRLTTSGMAITAAISPDGKRVAFSEREGDMQSLWIRDTDAPSDTPSRRLIAPSVENFVGITFAPGGEAVFYNTYNPNSAKFALSRVSADGDNSEPQQILTDISGAVGFSSDGKRVAYFRFEPKDRKMLLMVSELNPDGTLGISSDGERKIAEQQMPGYFTANPAFSPDDQKIAFASASVDGSKETLNLFVADLDTEINEKLGTTDFDRIAKIEWRTGGEEIILSGNRQNTEPLQLLLASYPSGEITKLTNDLDDYSGLSMPLKTSDSLITTKKTRRSAIEIVDLQTAGDANSETTTTPLTNGEEKHDGMRGISWTRDGRVVFTSGIGDENNVAILNSDGTGKRSFDLGDAFPASPVLTADNRFLFFVDQKDRESVLKRFETASGEIRLMSGGLSLSPALMPDDRFVIFSTISDSMRMSLYKIRVEGGEQTQLTDGSCIRAVASPDARFITCYYKPEQFTGKWQIAVLSSGGGAPLRIIDLPNTVNLQNAHELPLAWSADSRSIFYLNDKGGVSNIYRISADNSDASPEQVTRFAAGRIFDFAISPDGRKAVLARGETSSNVIIFRKSQ